MEYGEIIKKIKSLGSQKNVAGMARFGIKPKTKVYGVPIPELRKIAKDLKGNPDKNHKLAIKLWDSKIHEARILAGYIGEPEKMTEQQVEKWVKDFDSWDIVDQVCFSLLYKTKFAKKKVLQFATRKEEFVKRTAFTLIVCFTVHDKKMVDKELIRYFTLIKKASTDERNFVKKAVNWALRQIGKRNVRLNVEVLRLAREIKKIDSPSAKWIANGAIRELTSEAVKNRLKNEKYFK